MKEALLCANDAAQPNVEGEDQIMNSPSCTWSQPSDGIHNGQFCKMGFPSKPCAMLEWRFIGGRYFRDMNYKIAEISGFSSTGEPISIVFFTLNERSCNFDEPISEAWLLEFLAGNLKPYQLGLRVPLLDGFVKPAPIVRSGGGDSQHLPISRIGGGDLQHLPIVEKVRLRFDERGCNSQLAAMGSDVGYAGPVMSLEFYEPFIVLLIDRAKFTILFAGLVDDLPLSAVA